MNFILLLHLFFSSFLTSPFPRTCARTGRVNASLSLFPFSSLFSLSVMFFVVVVEFLLWCSIFWLIKMAQFFVPLGNPSGDDTPVVIATYLIY